jgi:hypothetical protein
MENATTEREKPELWVVYRFKCRAWKIFRAWGFRSSDQYV